MSVQVSLRNDKRGGIIVGNVRLEVLPHGKMLDERIGHGLIVCACDPCVVRKGETTTVYLGIKSKLPKDVIAMLTATERTGVELVRGTAVVHSGDKDEWRVNITLSPLYPCDSLSIEVGERLLEVAFVRVERDIKYVGSIKACTDKG